MASRSAKQLVEEAIHANRVMVFSKSTCPHSKRAKAILAKYLQKLGLMELDQEPDAAEIQQVLGEMTGARTVPRVFVDGRFIGGADQVAALEQSGELQKLLSAVAA